MKPAGKNEIVGFASREEAQAYASSHPGEVGLVFQIFERPNPGNLARNFVLKWRGARKQKFLESTGLIRWTLQRKGSQDGAMGRFEVYGAPHIVDVNPPIPGSPHPSWIVQFQGQIAGRYPFRERLWQDGFRSMPLAQKVAERIVKKFAIPVSWRTTKFKIIRGGDGNYRVIMIRPDGVFISTKSHGTSRSAHHEKKELARASLTHILNPEVGFQKYFLPSAAKHESGSNPKVETLGNIIGGSSHFGHCPRCGKQHMSTHDRVIRVGHQIYCIPCGEKVLKEKVGKHESGSNPLTLSEKLRMKTHTLSPAKARAAYAREKALMEEMVREVRELSAAIECCARCDRGAEGKAKRALSRARKSLVAAERLARYRFSGEAAESRIRALEAKVHEAEKALGEEETKRGEEAMARRAEKHEGGGNPRVIKRVPLSPAEVEAGKAFALKVKIQARDLGLKAGKAVRSRHLIGPASDPHSEALAVRVDIFKGGKKIGEAERFKYADGTSNEQTAIKLPGQATHAVSNLDLGWLMAKAHELGLNPVTMSVKEFEKLTRGRRRRRKAAAPPKRKKRRRSYASVGDVSLKRRMERVMGRKDFT